MSPEMVGVIGFIALLTIMFAGLPLGFAMILCGVIGYAVLTSYNGSLYLLREIPYRDVAVYIMCVLPLFTLMSDFASYSGASTDGYNAAYKWLGHLPGGVAITTIAGCAAFSAVCGSTFATAITMTKIALPEMDRHGYDPRLSLGSIAAGGTLGILIPPSTVMVVYGIYAQVSIGALFMAGWLPGILLALLFMATIFIWTKINPKIGPAGPRSTWRERFLSLKDIWSIGILILLVMGGIWGGIFTPTEAGGIGALGAFLILLSKKRFTWKNIKESLRDSSEVTASVFLVMIGASIYSNFIAMSKLPIQLASVINSLDLGSTGVIIFVLIIYAILGCFISAIAMVLLTLPIFLPLFSVMHIDLIWFGILLVLMCEMAAITPPVGMNVFVIHAITKHIPMYTKFKGVIPFVVAMFICIVILVAFPQVSLFLPNTMVK